MNNQVIIINGSGGCGKSTFVKLCHEICKQVVEISTVDYVKEKAYELGWDGVKDDKGSKLLSDLKDLLTAYGDIPFKKIQEAVSNMSNKIIFINSREPEEIERLKQEFNAITLLIKNPKVPKVTTNHADANVENYEYDYIIENDCSLNEYKKIAFGFLMNLYY